MLYICSLCFLVDDDLIGSLKNGTNTGAIYLSDSDSDVDMLQEIVAGDDSDSD